ncbi:MAG TPA: APC family permease [Clostridia bacterium]
MSSYENKEGKKSSGLKDSILSPIEVLAQSIASIAPSATPALVIPLVFLFAGNGTWLSYLFATIAIALVGANLNQYTKRSASSGSLYSFVVKGLGSGTGVISGWALVLAYLLTASAVLSGFINYANVLLSYIGVTLSPLLIGIIGAAIAWFIAVKDIKLSAKLMLTFEAVSLVLIFVLAVVVFVRTGFRIDIPQLRLDGITPSGIGLGLVLAFFSFVGFESATSLGDEAKKPLKTIPKAVTVSAVFVGVFFIILSYVEILGFAGQATKLNDSAAPLADLASFNGISFFGPLISIGALISFWSSFLACTNAGARVLFSMGQHGLFHSSVGNAHEENKTPHVAITISTVLAAAVTFILIILRGGLFDISGFYKSNDLIITIYGWTGTIATYGFIFVYALIAVSAPVYLKREKELKGRHIALSLITILALLVPIIGSVYSNATSPNPLPWFIYIFIGWLVIGGIWLYIRKIQAPEVSKNISGRVEDVHKYYRNLRANGDLDRT